MNRNMLRFGGAINLLFFTFQLVMITPIGTVLASLSPDVRATISTWSTQVAFILLIFAYFDIVRWRELLTTRLGNLVAIAIALFWFLRGIDQIVFYGLTAGGMPLITLCIAFGLLHLIPALRAWPDVKEAPHAVESPGATASKPQAVNEGMPWTAYAAIAWCVVFGGVHLYWALGGTAGFADFSMPSNRVLALTRDPLYMGITWGVVVACAVAAIVALAPFQAWTRRIPRWMVLTPVWIACGLFLVRGIGNPVQSALIVAGGMPFETLTGAEAQAWNQWLLLDAAIFSPWFILGGLAFGATAWFARRPGAAPLAAA